MNKKTFSKVVLSLVFGVCIMIVEFGFILPGLFSAKSDVFVIGGAIVLILSLPFWYFWGESIYELLTGEKNEKDSDTIYL